MQHSAIVSRKEPQFLNSINGDPLAFKALGHIRSKSFISEIVISLTYLIAEELAIKALNMSTSVINRGHVGDSTYLYRQSKRSASIRSLVSIAPRDIVSSSARVLSSLQIGSRLKYAGCSGGNRPF